MARKNSTFTVASTEDRITAITNNAAAHGLSRSAYLLDQDEIASALLAHGLREARRTLPNWAAEAVLHAHLNTVITPDRVRLALSNGLHIAVEDYLLDQGEAGRWDEVKPMLDRLSPLARAGLVYWMRGVQVQVDNDTLSANITQALTLPLAGFVGPDPDDDDAHNAFK